MFSFLHANLCFALEVRITLIALEVIQAEFYMEMESLKVLSAFRQYLQHTFLKN